MFFFDLPVPEERRAIFKVHIEHRADQHAAVADLADYDLDALVAQTEGFVVSEIEAAVVDGLYLAFDQGAAVVTTEHILQAARTTVPLRQTMAERIDALRDWAKNRARFSSTEAARAAGARQEAVLDLSGADAVLVPIPKARVARLGNN